jgi:hypothetical protein
LSYGLWDLRLSFGGRVYDYEVIGVRGWGLAFGVSRLEFGVSRVRSEIRCKAQDLGSRVEGQGFRV